MIPWDLIENIEIIYSTVCDNSIDEKLKCENVLISCALALSVEY